MPSPFLLLTEVAEEARVPVSTVRHWIVTGKLVSFRLGRRRLVRRTDLDAFVAKAEAREGETPAEKSSDGGEA